jgi:hypothetical protein
MLLYIYCICVLILLYVSISKKGKLGEQSKFSHAQGARQQMSSVRSCCSFCTVCVFSYDCYTCVCMRLRVSAYCFRARVSNEQQQQLDFFFLSLSIYVCSHTTYFTIHVFSYCCMCVRILYSLRIRVRILYSLRIRARIRYSLRIRVRILYSLRILYSARVSNEQRRQQVLGCVRRYHTRLHA